MTTASTVVEIFALIFWSFQLAPQCWLNYRNRSTAGLSYFMILCWSLGSIFTAIYNVAAELGVLFVIQPNLFLVFSLTCLLQCFFYRPHALEQPSNSTSNSLISNKIASTALLAVLLVSVSFGLQFGVAWSMLGQDSASDPFVVFNVLSLVFFVLGFAGQYHEIYRRSRVEGVSLLFLAIDMTGAALSVIALALSDDFQPISGACYIAVFILDGGIVILSFILKGEVNESSADTGAHNELAIENKAERIATSSIAADPPNQCKIDLA